jgi:hypothetical protein
VTRCSRPRCRDIPVVRHEPTRQDLCERHWQAYCAAKDREEYDHYMAHKRTHCVGLDDNPEGKKCKD